VPRTTATPALSGATRLFRAPAARYLTVPVGFLLIFFFLPLILIVLVSFTSSFPSASITLTTSNYVQFFGSSLYRAYLLTTIVYGLEVTVLCLLMGYPLAYYMVRQRGLVYQITLLAVIAPLLVGVVPRTVGWIAVLGTEGVINNILLGLHLSRRPLTLLYNPTAAVVGLAHVLLPFMVLSIASVLSLIDRSLREAAQNLGAGELQIFRRITIPLSLHGVAVGCALVFSLAIGSYITPVVLGGGKMKLLAPLAYDQFLNYPNWPFGSAVGVVLLVTGLVFVVGLPALVVMRRQAAGAS